MVSAMQQRGHCVCASHVTCSELTRAVAAVLCAVMLSAVAPLQQPFHARCLSRAGVRLHCVHFYVLAAVH